VGVVLGATLEPKLPYHSPALWRFRCFLLLILNNRAASSYQLLDLSLAGLPLDTLFFADPLSFEGVPLADRFAGDQAEAPVAHGD
jgi:hypothetical protein